MYFGERLKHQRIAVERLARVTGTRGKAYSRQSITGLDRNGLPRSDKLVAEAAQLRADIATVTRQLPGSPLVVASKAALAALALPDDAPQTYFGALRGLNTWERLRSAVIAGRESVSIEHLEAWGRAFLARDPEPLLVASGYVKATRMRRMRDGTRTPVEVEIHPDPRIQRVLEQIREAEIVQAVDRLRPIWNRREFALLNQLALDLTYDAVRSHAELVAGGNPLERAYLATGILPFGPRDLHHAHPGLFATERAAAHALAKYPLNPNRESYLGKWGILLPPLRPTGPHEPGSHRSDAASRPSSRAEGGDWVSLVLPRRCIFRRDEGVRHGSTVGRTGLRVSDRIPDVWDCTADPRRADREQRTTARWLI